MADDILVGTRIAGRFVVEERIGGGASGHVYRASQEPLARPVALKVLKADAADPNAGRRLEREGRAVAKLRHENIVVVYDAGATDDGRVYVAMELVDGITLRAHMQRGPLPWREAVDVARGICRALAAAHAAGIVHRDLKPENVMLAGGSTSTRDVRVLDFGLAKVHAEGNASQSESAIILGTPAYMSPEQAEGKGNDARSDLYSLGVILYEMLTGANPFIAESSLKTLWRHAQGPRPLPPSTLCGSIPAELDTLVNGLLSITPGARPADASAVESRLASLDAPSTPVEHFPRRPVAIAAAAFVAIALGGFGLAHFTTTRVDPHVTPVAPIAPTATASAMVERPKIVAPEATNVVEKRAEPSRVVEDRVVTKDATPPIVAPPARHVVVDAGQPEDTAEHDAPPPKPGTVAPAPPLEIPRGLPQKIALLRERCVGKVACADGVVARFDQALDDLDELKAVKSAADACLAQCR